MKELTPQQAALMALIEQYAEEKAHHFYDSIEGGYQWDTKADMDEALKAVEAAICTAIPDGWQLVPIEPTPEMCIELNDALHEWVDEVGSNEDVWRRTLAATPQPNT